MHIGFAVAQDQVPSGALLLAHCLWRARPWLPLLIPLTPMLLPLPLLLLLLLLMPFAGVLLL